VQQPPSPTPSEQPSPYAANQTSYQGQPQPAYPPYPGQPDYGYSFPPSQPQSTGKIALKYGLIFGAIMVVFSLLRFAFNWFIPQMTHDYHLSISAMVLYTLLLTAIFTLIYWGLYFCAGLFASRQTRQIGTASFACLWASLCYFAIYCVLTGISALTLLTRVGGSIIMTSYITSIGIGFAIVLFVQIGLGCGIGALGGLVGKNLVRKEPSPAPPMY
jgi:hypothetical protein